MSDLLESELDVLFQLLPDQYVEARGALMKRLRDAGDKVAVAAVKQLKRPTPAAWAINQLRFQRPALLEAARTRAEELRELHARDGIDVQQLSAALDAARRALAAAVDAALQSAQAAGVAAGAAQQRKILATLQAWLSGAGDEAPGRMTHELEPTGFDAVTVVGSAPLRAAEPVAGPAASGVEPGLRAGSVSHEQTTQTTQTTQTAPARQGLAAARPPAPDPQLIARAQALIDDCDKRARAARQQALQNSEQHERDQRELEQAQARVRDTEQALSALQEQAQQRAATLERSRAAAVEATRAQARADTELESARSELARLMSRAGHE